MNQNQSFEKRNFYGITPLMMSSLKGHEKIVEILISMTNVNIQDNTGNTALHYAVAK